MNACTGSLNSSLHPEQVKVIVVAIGSVSRVSHQVAPARHVIGYHDHAEHWMLGMVAGRTRTDPVNAFTDQSVELLVSVHPEQRSDSGDQDHHGEGDQVQVVIHPCCLTYSSYASPVGSRPARTRS
jgi:hypothetical protein